MSSESLGQGWRGWEMTAVRVGFWVCGAVVASESMPSIDPVPSEMGRKPLPPLSPKVG